VADSMRMPTGITSFDPVMEGGVPPGSVILLLGDIGAGSTEFVYSSVINLSVLKRNPNNQRQMLPEEIRYITFTKMEDDIRRDIHLSFDPEITAGLGDDVHFDDLSEQYFDASTVPGDWYTERDLMSRLKRRSEHKSTLVQLATVLGTVAENSLVILDSLTDIATSYSDTENWKELTAYLRGLQRVSKRWNTTIYMLLTEGILDRSQIQEIADITDAVILFRWEESAAARRQRVMYFQKFRGVMPHLEENDLVKFSVRISPKIGFEVSNIRVII